jgi:phospholipase D1/2
MFPRPVLTLFGSVAFGAWLGAAYGLIGIFIASLATYFAGHMLPEGTVRRVAGRRVERVASMLRRHGILAVLAIRVVPVAPSGVEGVIAGAMRIKLHEYLIGTMLGMTPGVLMSAFFGGQVATALDDPSKVNYWLIGAVVLVFGAMTFLVGRRLAKAAASPR